MSPCKPASALLLFCLCGGAVRAQLFTADSIISRRQADSVAVARRRADTTKEKIDSAAALRAFEREPRKATIRSAIIPGWGQWYNKKYWKIPIVYGGLITCVVIFENDVKVYKEFKRAFIIMENGDTALYYTLPTNALLAGAPAVQAYRNEVRQDVDFSVLAFILIWGLNVVDATVDAHLKQFDISNDLSLHLEPMPPLSGMSAAGLSVVMDIHSRHWKPRPLLANPIF